MEAAIWGFLGTLVGALASLTTTVVTARNQASLQSAASQQEREERFRAFQLDTLLEFQNAFHDLMRLVTRAHLEDVAEFKRTGVWGRNSLTEEVNDGLFTARRKVSLLIERVSDDVLRAELKELSKSVAELTFVKDYEVAERLFHSNVLKAILVMEKIGTSLRAQY